MKIIKKIYGVLRKVSDRLEVLTTAISAALVFGCFLAVFAQVINRYILVKQTLFHWESITWTDELSRFLLVGITYVSLGQIYRLGQMSRADIIYSRMKPTARKLLYYVEIVMMAIFLFVAIKYSFVFAGANAIYRSELLRIPGNVLYLLPGIGCILLSFEVLTELVGVMAGEVEPFDCLVKTDDISTTE